MSYLTQKTIKNNVSFNGVALHSGLDVNICIKPAEPNFGIIFKRVDFKENNFLLNNTKNNDDYLFLEVNFISIPNKFTFYFDKLLENHQINIKRYMSGDYIKSFFDIESKESMELFVMANKLNDGLNKNEVQLISKSKENRGFFEKFFQLFS